MAEIPADVRARRDEIAAEYGQWVATRRIYVGNALAYTAGQAVPASNVKLHGYDKRGLVERVGKQPVKEI